jgi:hypothetical protein
MTIRGFTWLYYSLIGCALVLFAAMLILALFAPYPADADTKKALAVLATCSAGTGLLVNSILGIKYKKMWIVFRGIGGLSDASAFWVAAHLFLAAEFFLGAYRTWTGIVPLKL